jgi:ABC-2 type transport system permease protein
MSTSELALPAGAAAAAAPRTRRISSRLLRSELRLVFRRRRNLAMLAVLSTGPILLGIAINAAGPAPGEGPPFFSQVTQNGLFLGLASVLVALPLFLPLAVSVVSGESVAGEASTGTLRNILVVPAGRGRLLLVKYAAVAAYAVACATTVVSVGIVTGLALFPGGNVVLLSGTSVSFGEALYRALLFTLYVAAMLATVGAIGVFFSTLTEVPMGAMAATATLTVIAQILDTIPQVQVIHEYLYTHWWLAVGDIMRDPIAVDDIRTGLLTQVVYLAVFGALAWARFTTKDVTS